MTGFPQQIEQALDAHGLPDPLTQRSSARPCQGAKFHSPRPLTTRHWRFGDDLDVYLCPTCEANLDILMHLNEQVQSLSWPVLREFGNQIRALGKQIAGAAHG